jgi:hypothetical protein
MQETANSLYSTITVRQMIERTTLKEIDISVGTTAIGANAFTNCSQLQRVTIPDSVKSIGKYAFQYCSLILNPITIPNSVTSIGESAFLQCQRVPKFNIGSGLKTIGERAFQGCSSITEITLPNTITSIATNAFNSCTKLTTLYCDWAEGEISGAPWGATKAEVVYLRKANTEGLQYALNEDGESYQITTYTGTETDIYIGSHYNGKPITKIADNAFNVQSGVRGGITRVDMFYSNIEYIGADAFALQNSLNEVHLPLTLKTIGNTAFDGCAFNNITIPNGVISIGSTAFIATQLININVPNSVETIGDQAFAFCNNLSSATLGYGCVSGMGNGVFEGCSNLYDIYVSWADGVLNGAPWGADNAKIHYNTIT